MSRILINFNFLKYSLITNSVNLFNKSFFSKKKYYHYYDYFYYLIKIKNINQKTYFLNFKNFFNFFQFFLNNNNKFIILDSNLQYINFINSLLFSTLDLIKYNNFFKFNLKFLKYQHFFFLFNSFLKKLNINFVIILDYKCYYLYIQYFNFLNLPVFSFVDSINFSKNLDYYYLFSPVFYNLEKIFFLSKVLQIYYYSIFNRRFFVLNGLLNHK